MKWIVIILGVFFCGAGTFFNAVLLIEANSKGHWITSLVVLALICVTVSFLMLQREWNMKVGLVVIAVAGIIQMAILSTIEPPSYWNDDDYGFLLFVAGFFSQPLNCLFAVGVGELVKSTLQDKVDNARNNLKNIIQSQVNALKEDEERLLETTREYQHVERLINLLDKVEPNDALKTLYINQIHNREANTLTAVGNHLREHYIYQDFSKIGFADLSNTLRILRKEKENRIIGISRITYEVGDYFELKRELKNIKKEKASKK